MREALAARVCSVYSALDTLPRIEFTSEECRTARGNDFAGLDGALELIPPTASACASTRLFKDVGWAHETSASGLAVVVHGFIEGDGHFRLRHACCVAIAMSSNKASVLQDVDSVSVSLFCFWGTLVGA